MPQPRRQLLVSSRSGGAWRLVAAALLILATIPVESCSSRMPAPYHDEGASPATGNASAPAIEPAAPAAEPASAPAPEPAATSFAATVRPILASRCAPCHNPGGKMYDKLPFDDPKTIQAHADGISRRLKGDDLAALQKWLASPPPPDAN